MAAIGHHTLCSNTFRIPCSLSAAYSWTSTRTSCHRECKTNAVVMSPILACGADIPVRNFCPAGRGLCSGTQAPDATSADSSPAACRRPRWPSRGSRRRWGTEVDAGGEPFGVLTHCGARPAHRAGTWTSAGRLPPVSTRGRRVVGGDDARVLGVVRSHRPSRRDRLVHGLSGWC